MSRIQKLVVAFWVFVGCMLLWQFYSYNQGLKQQAIDHPQQQHFWFTNSLASVHAAPAPPLEHKGAYVIQTAYGIEDNAPANGNFTIHVTLKNVGKAKATGVQVHVRPYRGMRIGDEDLGMSDLKILDENDPLSQYGEWVNFPDLAPGESSTQSVIFLSRSDATPVVNGASNSGIPGAAPKKLEPEIIYSSEKAK